MMACRTSLSPRFRRRRSIQLAFGPSGERLAVLSGYQLFIFDTQTGAVIDELDLGEEHTAMAFADNGRLYLGSTAGTLRVISLEDGGDRVMNTLWQGDGGMRWLEASAGSRFLILVDANNLHGGSSTSKTEESASGLCSCQGPSTKSRLRPEACGC